MAEVEKFKLSISMNATVTIFDAAGEPVEWVRPGSEAATTWRGMPSEAEVILGYQAMAQVAETTLEAVLSTSYQQVNERKAQGR